MNERMKICNEIDKAHKWPANTRHAVYSWWSW